MRLGKCFLNGAMLLEFRRFDDARGYLAVPYESEAARAIGLPSVFVQDTHSSSTAAGTLRGFHLQLPPFEQGKLVRVLRGRILDVVVDLRPGSASHGLHECVELSAESVEELWVPPGFGHGFCTLEPDTEVFYKVDAPFAPEAERTLAWDDPALSVEWPVTPDTVVLSDKDAAGLSLRAVTAEIAAARTGAAR